MADVTPLLSMAGLAGYLAIAYVIGALLAGLVTAAPGGILRATSPILGGSALAIQLWIYGAVHVPWNPLTLLIPWVVVVGLRRSRLRRAITADWLGAVAEARRIIGAGALSVVFCVTLVGIAFLYLLNLVTQPVLGWDAIAMWLFKAGVYYAQQAVNLAPIATEVRRNLDYPPLYTLMVDSLYALNGGVDEIFGKSVTYLFFVSGIAGFYVMARDLLGRQLAITFTFVVAATPIFLKALFDFQYMGWADYPFAILMLVSLLHFLDGLRSGDSVSYALSIVFAALSAFTKNEGLTFLAIMLLVVGITYARAIAQRTSRFVPDWKLVAVVALGVAPLIAWRVYLQLQGIQTARVLGDESLSLLPGLPNRTVAVLREIRSLASLKLDYPWLAVSFALSLVLVTFSRARDGWLVLIVIGLQIAAYFYVYLTAPFDVQYIVSTTFDRLTLQLTPSIVLLLAIAIHPYVTAEASRRVAD